MRPSEPLMSATQPKHGIYLLCIYSSYNRLMVLELTLFRSWLTTPSTKSSYGLRGSWLQHSLPSAHPRARRHNGTHVFCGRHEY